MSPARVAHGSNPLRDPRDKRLPRIAGPCGLVLFGVTGDLARKKLMPAIYDLANRGLLPPGFAWSASPGGTGPTRTSARSSTTPSRPHARTPFREEVWRQLAEGFRFVPGTFDDPEAFDLLAETVRDLDEERGHRWQPRLLPLHPARLLPHGVRAAGPQRPVRPPPTVRGAGSSSRSRSATTSRRARELNDIVERVFPPDSVFRIDHYLGKETVQNLLALRFANQMFEPIWNANYVDHVQITMAEDIGIGGRAGYYDGIGAARDVIQNHLLQLLALTAMEEPVSFDAKDLRAEKEKVLSRGPPAQGPGHGHRPRAVRRRLAGRREGRSATCEEEGIPKPPRPRPTPRSSSRSTPGAGRACRSTCAPASGWAGGSPRSRSSSSAPRTCRSPTRPPRSSGQNALVIRVQPDEGVTIRFGSKVPGAGDGGPRRDDGLRLRPRPSPSPAPRPTSGSSSTCCSATRRCSRGTRRSSCPGRSSTRSRRTGPSRASPSSTAAGTWGPASADEMLARDGRNLEAAVIVDLPSTTTARRSSKKLVGLRDDGRRDRPSAAC